MESYRKNIFGKDLNYSNEEKENSLGFELIIKDFDIEKKMTEFTFKQLFS